MATAEPVAIIDIGSNSVRLVVYAGPPRIPTPIFNEKVLAGLGSKLDETGALSERAREMIRIAHPGDREELEKQWKRPNGVSTMT